MTISIDGTPSVMGLGSGRTYRVGDAAVTVNGNRISSVNDDGLVFDTVEFADASGLGLGNLTTYHLHDNTDGSMTLFYQIRDADPLPVTISNWKITLDAATGAAVAPAEELTEGPLSATDQTMLHHAYSLPDGNILIHNWMGLSLMDNDGALVTSVGNPGFDRFVGGVFGEQLSWSTVGLDGVFAVGAARTVGSGAPAALRFYSYDGTAVGDVIDIGNPDNTGLGNTPAVQLERLSDGNLLVVWVENNAGSGDDSQTSVWFKILSASGAEIRETTLVNTEETRDRQDMPIVTATENGFVIGYSVLTFSAPALNEGRLKEFANDGTELSLLTSAYNWSADDFVRTDNNTAIIVGGLVTELVLPGDDTPLHSGDGGSAPITGSPNPDVLTGTAGDDTILGLGDNDRLLGDAGNDSLDGGPGADTLNGGEGNDVIIGGPAADDLRDVIYAGAGDDSIDAGAGNDQVFGQAGNDTIAGGAGVDDLQGQDGDDVITGSAFSDLVFGGAGNDFVNGGFGHDRINGGSGADKFFHVGVEGHGSDWVQDYVAADGDVLLWGGGAATAGDFQVNLAHTANDAGERSGDDGVQEAFVIYKPSEQIIWALVDGGGQSAINIQIGGDTFDLLA
ncbi:hypothetical protein K3727_06500 [Rhodobacteraceae bacterium M382]|nr:hypothetical protein K3727_06500 [Rhodobacteraceae bacterium M382]